MQLKKHRKMLRKQECDSDDEDETWSEEKREERHGPLKHISADVRRKMARETRVGVYAATYLVPRAPLFILIVVARLDAGISNAREIPQDRAQAGTPLEG